MAVYTDITEDDLSGFLTQYDVGTLTSYKGIAEGVENTNFLLQTTKGAYILTLYEKRVDQNDLPFFLGLMHHLAGNGLSCPLPIAAVRRQAARRTLRPSGCGDLLSRTACGCASPMPVIAAKSARRWPPCMWPAKALN